MKRSHLLLPVHPAAAIRSEARGCRQDYYLCAHNIFSRAFFSLALKLTQISYHTTPTASCRVDFWGNDSFLPCMILFLIRAHLRRGIFRLIYKRGQFATTFYQLHLTHQRKASVVDIISTTEKHWATDSPLSFLLSQLFLGSNPGYIMPLYRA